jgi:hypothetical protein
VNRLLIILFMGIQGCYSQSSEHSISNPEVFTSGFIDVMNSGQVNASARILRTCFGEPGKFSIPVSIYSGVSSQGFQGNNSIAPRSNEMLASNFINPLSGLVNVSFENLLFIQGNKKKLTNFGILYQFGERILTGFQKGTIASPVIGRPVNFLNTFFSPGLYFQTGAWEKGNQGNLGITWFVFRYIATYTDPLKLKEWLPGIETNGIYLGYSIGWGIEITRLVNAKVIYYRYVKGPEIEYFQPVYQFTFNYSLKNGS